MDKKEADQRRGIGACIRSLWEGVLYRGLFLAAKLLSLLPFGALYVISDICYYPLYYVARYRRGVTRRNLTESFPEKSVEEIVAIEKRFYRFLADVAFESLKLLSASKEEIARRMRFTNIEEVNRLLGEGRSVSAFLGHYGNWEWLSTTALHTVKGAVVALVYHKLRNEPMDRLMRKIRESAGGLCVDMHQTVRFMAGTKAEGTPCMIGLIADQSPKMREVKHFMPFLNHKVPVLTGSEKTTKRYGYEAVFASVKRVRRGYYECEFSKLHEDPASLPDFELTRLYYARLEREINETPELYLWTHNRFKHAVIE